MSLTIVDDTPDDAPFRCVYVCVCVCDDHGAVWRSRIYGFISGIFGLVIGSILISNRFARLLYCRIMKIIFEVRIMWE